MEDFVACPSRWRIALLILAAAGFVALGLWMIGAFGVPPESRRYPATLVAAIGWVCVIFFGACGVIAIRRLFDGREQVRIGAAGIRITQWSDATIPWSEIDDVTTWTFRRQTSILLHLRDASRFPGRGLAARLAGANRAMTGGDIAISLTGTDRRCDEALAAIERYAARRASRI